MNSRRFGINLKTRKSSPKTEVNPAPQQVETETLTTSYVIRFRPKTVRKLVLWGFIGIAFLGLIALLPALQSVVSILVIALFLSVLLEPFVSFIENRGVSRLLASVLVFALILFSGALGFNFMAPVITHEIEQIGEGLNDGTSTGALDKLQERLGESIPLLANPALLEEIRAEIDAMLKRSFSMVVSVLSAIVSIVMLAFITFFFLKDGRTMKKAIISWVPNRYFEMTLIIVHKIGAQLGRYLRGQLFVASIVGAMSIFALYLLDIRYYFFIGAIAGIANMIPYFGPIVGAVPAVVIALIDTGSLGTVAAVAVAFACVQLIENVAVSPFIVSKSVQLHPLTIIIVILIGGQLLGIFGMLLAVPSASIIKVTSQEIAWGIRNYRVL